MSRLEGTPAYQELLALIREREHLIDRFYLDSENLVTIGYGHLVELRELHNSNPLIHAAAIALFHSGIVFLRGNAVVTNDAEVGDDVVRVNQGQHAQLHISKQTAEDLMVRDVARRITSLYAARPFVADLNPYIAAALVDVLFQPVGVALFRETPGQNFYPQIPRLWRLLDPNSSEYNLSAALQVFDTIWATRGPARFHKRHLTRLHWFMVAIKEEQTNAQSQAAQQNKVMGLKSVMHKPIHATNVLKALVQLDKRK